MSIHISSQRSPLELSRIKYWPTAERPRERLIAQGPGALSDAELVAILIRNGTRGTDAVTLARELLREVGGLRNLLALSVKKLTTLRGLGEAKSAGLAVVSEMVRRSLREKIIQQNFFQNPEEVMNYLFASLRDKKTEVFKILFLNKAHHLIDEVDFSEGTLDSAAIYPREVVRAAFDRHASALILIHNHPSGVAKPSEEDKKVTQKIQEACCHLGVEVLDHLIVGDNVYFSFLEEGILKI